jgi:hypothetical protein
MDYSPQEKHISSWKNTVFYLMFSLLIIVVFLYGLLALKTYFQRQMLAYLDSTLAVSMTGDQKANEQKLLNYKKKIEDFAVILNDHRISLNVFNFIEQNTLKNVWFSNFSMSESADELRLTGEADTMNTLSQQVDVFEKSKDYIKGITVLNSQTQTSGRIKFVINLSLNQKIFTYVAPVPAPASATTVDTGTQPGVAK